MAHQTRWKTKFSSHKQYLFGLLFSRNVKKAHIDQNTLQTFLLCLKRNVSQTFKSSSCKKVFFKCIYHSYNLPRQMFFIPCDNSKSLFLNKFIVTQRFGALAMLLSFLRQVIWKKTVFYIRYLRNIITMLLVTKVQNKVSIS